MIISVREIINNEDHLSNLKKVKEIQMKWKSIGPIPRKISSNLWNEFNELCNLFLKK